MDYGRREAVTIVAGAIVIRYSATRCKKIIKIPSEISSARSSHLAEGN